VSKVLLITSLGCTPCTRVKRVLSELQSQMPDLIVEEMEFASPNGSRLAMEHGILYPPAVFIDGTIIAKGKIDADKMIATIREMNGAHN
jgi:predicted thioredoxin/glutaredoxin